MHVDVGQTLHDRGDFGPRRTHLHQRAVQLLADPQRDRRRSGARHHDPRWTRVRRWRRDIRGGQGDALRGQSDRACGQFAGFPQRHMHRPVGAAELGELPGAVERVDDPHPLGFEPSPVVGALLGEHRVGRPGIRQRLHQEFMRPLVAGRLSLCCGGVGQFLAHGEQQVTGLGRQPGGQLVVAHPRESSRSMTCCANSSRLWSAVSRRSGCSGRW